MFDALLDKMAKSLTDQKSRFEVQSPVAMPDPVTPGAQIESKKRRLAMLYARQMSKASTVLTGKDPLGG